jgi:hypothetical protein
MTPAQRQAWLALQRAKHRRQHSSPPDPAPVALDPAALGASAWWRGDDIAVADGAEVYSWPDRISGVLLYSNGSSPYVPIFRATGLNTQPALESDGNQTLAADFPAASGATFTLLLVLQPAGTTPAVVLTVQDPNTYLGGYLNLDVSPTDDHGVSYLTSGPGEDDHTLAAEGALWQPGETVVFGLQADANQPGFWRNGQWLALSSAALLPVSFNYLSLGGLPGLLGELVLFNRVLTAAEMVARS